MLSSGFFPAIDRATRITATSATLIDNIYTNVHHKSIKSYIWITDISDHLPVCATIPGKMIKYKLGPSHAMKRIYTEDNMHNFRTKLSETDWTEVLGAPCTSTKYSHFINIIDTLHNKCFPLTKVKINPIKDSKPWITSTLLNSIKRKNNLYKQYLNNKSNTTLEKYKKYKNKLTSILRLAEKNYFSNKLLEAKNNLSQTWQIINNITNRTTSKKSVDQILDDGSIIDDPHTMAEKFNNFFVNIGSNLAKQIIPVKKKTLDFMEGDFSNSIFLNPTAEEEIGDIITNLKNSKSTGQDNIPTKIIKHCKLELSSILSHIFNQSLIDGIFSR